VLGSRSPEPATIPSTSLPPRGSMLATMATGAGRQTFLATDDVFTSDRSHLRHNRRSKTGLLTVGNRLDLNPNNRIPVLVELLCYASRLDSGAIGSKTDWVHHLRFF
jgi:hypothetical protein